MKKLAFSFEFFSNVEILYKGVLQDIIGIVMI
jgi:hypothetical protein